MSFPTPSDLNSPNSVTESDKCYLEQKIREEVPTYGKTWVWSDDWEATDEAIKLFLNQHGWDLQRNPDWKTHYDGTADYVIVASPAKDDPCNLY